MTTHYEINETYGLIFRVERTKVELSEGAFALFNYARHKGNTFLLDYDNTRNVFALELVRAGLFIAGDTHGGYYEYKIVYAEPIA